MKEAILKAQLESIAQSYRRFQLWRGLAFCWGLAAVVSGVLLLLHALIGWSVPIATPLLLGLTLISGAIVWLRARRLSPAYRWIARQVEEENPRLNTLLLAAVEQQPDPKSGEFGFLQDRVVEEALAHNQKEPWVQNHLERLFFAQCVHFLALALFLGLFVPLTIETPKGWTLLDTGREITVTPGDASVERGSTVVVLARFRGPVPAEATLVVDSSAGTTRRISLAKNLDDPVFGGSIPEIKTDLVYHIEYGLERSPGFKVTTFDHPELQRADADLAFPEYTGQTAKRIEDTRRISAVEGTVLNYTFHLNKPVASASLVARDKTAVPLVTDPGQTNVYQMKMTLEQSKTYELRLVDNAGRTNKIPTDIVIDVLPNRAPELKVAHPRQDLRASPLEELRFQATASDDFGLKAVGLAYTLAGHETKYVELSQAAGANEKKQISHLLALEELKAQPDELLTYFVWADDFGPDGQVRRTSSDMYFAEVRHFEEIFREGQQQPGGNSREQQQGGQQSQSEKLAELQKQIINATWKLQRQETKAKPSAGYKKDISVVHQSQEKALEQAGETASRSENPRLKPLIETVVKEMERALIQLKDAVDHNTIKPLPTALAAEQAAYQALLKLQAREYEVTRGGRGGGGGGGGGQRLQQQLDQLDLKQAENRYETQRQASQQQAQTPEQKEQLQFLNRLKELARRQLDMNQRLQELQTALQEAKSEEEREAVRRQLKRLREEEQEVLDDVDELRQRMNRSENQSQVAEARKQLEQTRSEVRKTAQELENGAVSQALASGTRAQRELQQLRDDFRKKTSSQFAEEMRQMRSGARELAQREEDLAKKIEAASNTQRKSLSDSGERNQLAEQFGQQKSGLTNLLNNVRRVTEQSEAVEPLLSKQLYDTFRRTDQAKANESFDLAGELLRRGFVPQAGEAEKPVRSILDQLKRGVEHAAEGVLGDEMESLRQARNELDDLTQQLEKEIAQADPKARQGSNLSQQNNGTNSMSNAQGQTGSRAQARSGERAGSNQDSGEQNGQQASAQQGNRSGQSAQNQRGQGQGGQGGQGQRGQRGDNQQAASNSGQAGESGAAGQGQAGQPGSSGQRGSSQRQSLTAGGPNSPSNSGRAGGSRSGGGGSGGGTSSEFLHQFGGWTGPITGPEYSQWADRLRDVEEMVDVPELRNQIAQVLDRARGMRIDLKRHSKEPQWDIVRTELLAPLVEIRQRLGEELARRELSDPLVPIDRDPVPKKYSDLVRRYYETLGNSQ